MKIYWLIMFVTIIICFLSALVIPKRTIIEGQIEYKMPPFLLIFNLGFLCFFVGLRDKVLDTGAYISAYKSLPTEWNQFKNYLASSDAKGFTILEWLFKRKTDNHYIWLSFLAILSCFCLFRIIYKYSRNVALSLFLFIASSMFTWLLNGIRQFLVVCILFTFTDWLIKGKNYKYILMALLLSSFHISALFVAIVALFMTSKEIFSKKIILFGILTVIGTGFSEKVFDFLSTSLKEDYTTAVLNGTGSNILHLFIAMIPVLIVLLNFKNVRRMATPSIKLAINMSFVGCCFYFASTFTNGILVGRMPIYFTVYNLYLLPWLIENCFLFSSRRLVTSACVSLYFALFYYQLVIAWDGLMYVSEILHISCY